MDSNTRTNRIRVIPSLLLNNYGLVKTKKFKKPVYIGDPRNAVKIFNDKEADELVLLDITATVEKRSPDFKFIEEIVSEAFMPVGYGGGIKCMEDIEKLFRIGIEKVIINTYAFISDFLIKEAVARYGSQSIVASIDVRKNVFGRESVYLYRGQKNMKINPIDYAKMLEQKGVGEIYLTSIDHEGCMHGYNIQLIKNVCDAVSVPVIANGGAGTIDHMKEAIVNGHASAVSAGSLFVYHGNLNGILINYPSQKNLSIFYKSCFQSKTK